MRPWSRRGRKWDGFFGWISRKCWIVKVCSSLGWALLCGGASWRLPLTERKWHENLVTCTLLDNHLLQSCYFFPLSYSHCWRQVMGSQAGQPGISCTLISTDPLTPLPLSCYCATLQGCSMSEVVAAFLQTALSGVCRAPRFAPRSPAAFLTPRGRGSPLTLHGVNWKWHNEISHDEMAPFWLQWEGIWDLCFCCGVHKP